MDSYAFCIYKIYICINRSVVIETHREKILVLLEKQNKTCTVAFLFYSLRTRKDKTLSILLSILLLLPYKELVMIGNQIRLQWNTRSFLSDFPSFWQLGEEFSTLEGNWQGYELVVIQSITLLIEQSWKNFVSYFKQITIFKQREVK